MNFRQKTFQLFQCVRAAALALTLPVALAMPAHGQGGVRLEGGLTGSGFVGQAGSLRLESTIELSPGAGRLTGGGLVLEGGIVPALGGCAPAILQVSPQAIAFGWEGGTEALAVANLGGCAMPWTADVTAGNSWLNVSPGSGTNAGTVSVTAAQNLTCSERNATISIRDTDNNVVKTVAVSQAVPSPRLHVDPAELNYDEGGAAHERLLQISNSGTGEMRWSATVLNAASTPWLTLEPTGQQTGNGSLRVRFTRNTGAQRTGTIRIVAASAGGCSAADGTRDISFTQGTDAQPAISVSPASRQFSSAAGCQGVLVRNTGGKPINWAVAESLAWASVSPSSGTLANGAEASVSICLVENPLGTPRTGTLTFSATSSEDVLGSPAQVDISQDPTITVQCVTASTNSLPDADYRAGSTSFTIFNPDTVAHNWSATASENFITGISPRSGTLQPGQTQTITVSYAKNEGPSPRSASINLTVSCLPAPSPIGFFQGEQDAVIRVTPQSSTDLGSVRRGSAHQIRFTVENVGGKQLDGQVQISGPSGFAILNEETDYHLVSGASTEFTVQFTATEKGNAEATVTFTGGGVARHTIRANVQPGFLGCGPGGGATGSPMGDLVVICLVAGALGLWPRGRRAIG